MERSLDKNKKGLQGSHFPIVGIGASAGGLHAVTELLENLPADTGMAFVYIQHLDPNHESSLVSILSRVSLMPVIEVQDSTPVAANHFHVIPPNKTMVVENGILKLTARPPKPIQHLPIDSFFLSLANNYKERAIGVILSGTASDGTLGLKAIKREGGLAFAQDDSAQFQGMPKSAVAEGAVDAIMSAKEIGQELERLSKKSNLYKSVLQPDEDEEPSEIEKKEEQNGSDQEDLKGVLRLIKAGTGVDFTYYKQNTIRRRVVRRMLLQKLENLPDYIDYLKKNTVEIKALYNDLLINVTHFFRDAEANTYLRKELLPMLLKDRAINNPLRIWVPACSTGEEVYSVAILILELLEDNPGDARIQIFGTDLSEMAIAKARAAIYTHADVANVSQKRLDKYFVKQDGHFRVLKHIRDLCVFATHNVFKDPPFSRVDLVSCCNVLIYLETPLQKKILANFHYSLNSNGYLLLGQSETVGASVTLFTHSHKQVKVYRKKNDVASRVMFDLNYNLPDVEPIYIKSNKSDKPTDAERAGSIASQAGTNLDKVIDSVLLSKYTPAGVVITHALDIVQFRGSLNLYVEHAAGRASLNLLKMARPGLGLELRNAAQKVIKSGQPEKKSGIEINYQGNLHYVTFEVTPLDELAKEPLLLIVFQEEKDPITAAAKSTHSKDRRVKQLEDEIIALRDDMRTIVEEQEVANEELQSANEEIVSSNEELQSINEELETSKEELESSNEELITINQELIVRNDQLAESQEYTAGMIATIREAVLVMDNNLKIITANKAFYYTFSSTQKETEGKLIYELANSSWNIPALKELLENILPRNGHFTGYKMEYKFDGLGEKVLMLNVRKMERKRPLSPIILLAIEDITEHSHAERLLEEREAWLRNMANNVPVMIWVAGPDKNFTFLNNTWLAFTGRTLLKETGIGWTEGVYREDLELCLSTYHLAFEKRTPFNIEYRMKRSDGEYRWILNSAVPTFDADGEFTGYTGSCIEIHDKRVLHEELEHIVQNRTMQLQEANKNLERTNSELQQFAYVASHDLQEPLRKIITFSNRLKDRFGKDLPDNGKEFLEKIYTSSNRMRNLIDDLLNFSSISQFEKAFLETDLNIVLKNVLTDFDLSVQEKNAILRIGQLPVIEAIPLQINQLFHNLISNAFKFSSKKANPQIEISCRVLPEKEIKKHPRLSSGITYQEIVFRDNGVGFPQQYADQIFVIFQRLHNKGQYLGTGIGLALCQKIVTNHKGEIYAESIENIGSAFYIILPAKQIVAEEKDFS